jgi:transglutaminase-like putative cysteine protease
VQPIRFDIALFSQFPDQVRTDAERARSQRALLFLLDALSAVNVTFLKASPDTPSIYTPRMVRYVAEPETENWRDIPTIFAKGNGDCEDLASARVAELRQSGIRSRPWVSWRKAQNGKYIYHARTWRESIGANMPPIRDVRGYMTTVEAPPGIGGYIEDPSIVLGMYGPTEITG